MNKKKGLVHKVSYLAGLCLCSLILFSCGSKRVGGEANLFAGGEDERYVVVLSLDGFRADYQSKANTPNLDAMDRDGLSGSFRPCYPSLTFPNHYSMATGLYPNNHGLVGNEFWDTEGRHYKLGKRESVENPIFYLGEPIWNTAGRQGIRSASYFWVGSETAISGRQPDIWKRYDSKIPYRDRADSVLSWLQLPPQIRPRLIMWYLDEPDHTGHHTGPESNETKQMVERVDSVVGYFRDKLAMLPIASKVDFILVSDHGMMAFDPTKIVNLAEHIPSDMIEHIATGPFTHVYPKDGLTEQVLERLKAVPGIKAYKKEELPSRLHYGSSDRIGRIVVLAEAGVTMVYRPEGEVSVLAAGHGYDNDFPEMLALFKAVGVDFREGRRLDTPIPNITLYPLICKLLGIKPSRHDADEALAESLLKR